MNGIICVKNPKTPTKSNNNGIIHKENTNSQSPSCYRSYLGKKSNNKYQKNDNYSSFALPDDPIFSKKDHNLKEDDPTVAKPQDINVNINYINDSTCFSACQDVITPYQNVESLFPFDVESIRFKADPEYHQNVKITNKNDEEILLSSSSPKQEKNKSNNNNNKTIKTIKISNSNTNQLKMSELKAHVMKALENVMKKKNSPTKIEIVSENKRKMKKPTVIAHISEENGVVSKKGVHKIAVNNAKIEDKKLLPNSNINNGFKTEEINSKTVVLNGAKNAIIHKGKSPINGVLLNKLILEQEEEEIISLSSSSDEENKEIKSTNSGKKRTRNANGQHSAEKNNNLKKKLNNIIDLTIEKKPQEFPKDTDDEGILSIKNKSPVFICTNERKKPEEEFCPILPRKQLIITDTSFELEQKDIKFEKDSYNLGDLVWAQLAKFPYWPAIICTDPESGLHFTELESPYKTKYLVYHLRFFGDHGKRSWVSKNRLMMYYSKYDLELILQRMKTLKRKPKEMSCYQIKKKSPLKWNLAIEEIEFVRYKTYEEIIKYLLESTTKNHCKMYTRKKRKLSTNNDDLLMPLSKKIKIELIEENEQEEINLLDSSQQIIKQEPETGATELEEIGKSPKTHLRRSGRSFKAVNRLDVLELRTIDKILMKEQKNSSFIVDTIKTEIIPKEEPLQEDYEENNVLMVDLEESNNSSITELYSYEFQAELHKRNNLFNGYRNIKVCYHCLKQSDIYKCKGKCCGYFHLECASSQNQPISSKKIIKSPSKKRKSHNLSASSPRRRSARNQCKVSSSSSAESPESSNLSLQEQIDVKMMEMMSKIGNPYEIIDVSSDDETMLDLNMSSKSSESAEISEKSVIIKHVTADSILLNEDNGLMMDAVNLKCTYCRLEQDPPCFICGFEVIGEKSETTRRKCASYRCGRFYHSQCLKSWPQTQRSIGKWSKNNQLAEINDFTCPLHICHTCFSDELGSSTSQRLPGDKLARCMLCPAAYHTTTLCIPAGTEILGGSQIICPRHRTKPIQPINTNWCFICSQGGDLVCCDTCPTSVHPECQPINYTEDNKYICEECESGRFPLYDEIVWVKLGKYRWWPAVILFSNEVPENVRKVKHQKGDFVVRFFGTHDHYWVNKFRSFLFQEDDQGSSPGEMIKSKNKVYATFQKAVEDAAEAYKLKKEFKKRLEAESMTDLKPPPYTKINKNKAVGNIKCNELNLSNATACECDSNWTNPCGVDSNCINRLLLTECDPEMCPAGENCRNQLFQKREYPPLVPYKTQGRGWGLKTLAPIQAGQFVIEYVGELIDTEEYQRRIRIMHEKKETNFYFMTVDTDRLIDAGPKGNVSRFMNHSCSPNCVTQKWTVKGDTHVGLFAKCAIEPNTELTFNYNLEVVGQGRKICRCGASNCSGYIGAKVKLEKMHVVENRKNNNAEMTRKRKYTKRKVVYQPVPACFVCGHAESDLKCCNKLCNKGYHLNCLNLTEMPDVRKFICSRHNCNICSHRTSRCCIICTNSFCPSHSEGNVTYNKEFGFLCWLHQNVPDQKTTIISKNSSSNAVNGLIINNNNNNNNNKRRRGGSKKKKKEIGA